MQIAHIINPVVPPSNSDLDVAQPITFESMRQAKSSVKDKIEVELLAAIYPEDEIVYPEGFERTKDLERSVLDLGEFSAQRKLPILKDILDRAYHYSDAEWVVYTNVDIALMPYFYDAIDSYVRQEDDALIINRRNISVSRSGVDDLTSMYAHIGKPHPGYDCFVFPRSWIPNLDVGGVCVGIPYVGLMLALAIKAKARSLRLIDEGHLTFHIGNDRHWRNEKFNDYRQYNAEETRKAVQRIEATYGRFDDSLPSWAFFAVSQLMEREIPGGRRGLQIRERILNRFCRYFRRTCGNSNP